jgi:hypothetical protein
MRKFYIVLVFILISSYPHTLHGQLGGDNIYEFLNLTWSARASALGGTVISLSDGEPSFAFHNPSAAEKELAGTLSLGYVNYLSDISYGSALYFFNNGNRSVMAAGMTWLNYGNFTEADNAGNITGSFRASEYALNLIFSRTIDTLFSFGINVKPVISQLEQYNSLGLAFDFGAAWRSRDQSLSAALVIRNTGVQITTYAGESREKLPFEIQAGISKRLTHAPFRFTLTLRNLQKFDLTHRYDTASLQGVVGSTGEKKDGFTENLFRHVLVGAECIPHRNFWFGAGYNYQRRSELKVASAGAPAGFSWGFGANISGFRIGFSRALYHLAGGSNQFALSFNPGQIYRRITD